MAKRFDSDMYQAALAYYGLPTNYNRTFKKTKTALAPCSAARESGQGNAVWVQINHPFDGAATTTLDGNSYPKKATNADIEFIGNVTLDFEYPQVPDLAHTVGIELAPFLIEQGLAEPGLPIEDSGGGCHIVLPLPAIGIAKGEGDLWNRAVAALVKERIVPRFEQLVQEVGIKMNLGGFDISRVLSAPGTWRSYRADKGDCEALREGYLRRWLPPYEAGSYPERRECATLASLIQEKYVQLKKEMETPKPKSTSFQAPARTRLNTQDPGIWLEEYASHTGRDDRSVLFQSLVSACYLKFGEEITRQMKGHIDDLSGNKYNGRLGVEFERSLGVAMKTPRTEYQPFSRASGSRYGGLEEGVGKTTTEGLEQALEKTDLVALFGEISTLAKLPPAELALWKSRIKMTFGKTINLNDLERAINEERKASRDVTGSDLYSMSNAGMFYHAGDRGVIEISNFSARILADITTDDGAEQARSYLLEASVGRQKKQFEVIAKEFSRCEWVDERIGARARITAGSSMRSHVVNAIKYCSEPEEYIYYAHTGWRKIDNHMIYLHMGGHICQVCQKLDPDFTFLTNTYSFQKPASRASSQRLIVGKCQVCQICQKKKTHRVKLPPTLDRYQFPEDLEGLNEAIRTSLSFLDIASNDLVTAPLYAAMWRSVLGEVDFGLHLAGQTGQGKSALAMLIQQHFGGSIQKFPGSWGSTENSLEMLLFQAKDTVVVVDDFKPTGSKTDQDRLHSKADRIFRQIGNGASRGRLSSTLEQRAARPSRCLLLSTGEDIPRGESLKARSIVLFLEEKLTKPGSEASKRLTVAQKQGASGLFAKAMAGFITWLAPQIEALQEQLPDLIASEREHLSLDGHARLGTNTANLLIGMRCFLQFACDQEAITGKEADVYLTRVLTAMSQIAAATARESKEDRPSEQWRRLLISALTGKKAHLVTKDGDRPGLEYGWTKSVRSVERDGTLIEEETFHPAGTQIGWIDGEDIYLDHKATYGVIRALGNATGDEITTLEPTLRKFLAQDKMLASTDLDKARKTVTVRRYLQKAVREVLHIRVSLLYDDKLDISDKSGDSPAPEADLTACQTFDNSGNSHADFDKSDMPTQQVGVDLPNEGEKESAPHTQPALSREEINSLATQMKRWLKTQPGDTLLFWDVPESGYAAGDVSTRDYYERLRGCILSEDPVRMRAVVNVMLQKLSQIQREVEI